MATTEITYTGVKKIVMPWVSDASGDAVVQTTNIYDGKIIAVAIIPGAGAVQPTNEYDLTLTDSLGIDLLLGGGADASNTTPAVINQFLTLAAAGEKLTLTVSNAGDTKEGTLVVYLR